MSNNVIEDTNPPNDSDHTNQHGTENLPTGNQSIDVSEKAAGGVKFQSLFSLQKSGESDFVVEEDSEDNYLVIESLGRSYVLKFLATLLLDKNLNDTTYRMQTITAKQAKQTQSTKRVEKENVSSTAEDSSMQALLFKSAALALMGSQATNTTYSATLSLSSLSSMEVGSKSFSDLSSNLMDVQDVDRYDLSDTDTESLLSGILGKEFLAEAGTSYITAGSQSNILDTTQHIVVGDIEIRLQQYTIDGTIYTFTTIIQGDFYQHTHTADYTYQYYEDGQIKSTTVTRTETTFINPTFFDVKLFNGVGINLFDDTSPNAWFSVDQDGSGFGGNPTSYLWTRNTMVDDYNGSEYVIVLADGSLSIYGDHDDNPGIPHIWKNTVDAILITDDDGNDQSAGEITDFDILSLSPAQQAFYGIAESKAIIASSHTGNWISTDALKGQSWVSETKLITGDYSFGTGYINLYDVNGTQFHSYLTYNGLFYLPGTAVGSRDTTSNYPNFAGLVTFPAEMIAAYGYSTTALIPSPDYIVSPWRLDTDNIFAHLHQVDQDINLYLGYRNTFEHIPWGALDGEDGAVQYNPRLIRIDLDELDDDGNVKITNVFNAEKVPALIDGAVFYDIETYHDTISNQDKIFVSLFRDLSDTQYSASQLFMSADSGTSWSLVYESEGEFPISLAATANGTIFANPGSGLFKSTDYGVNFDSVTYDYLMEGNSEYIHVDPEGDYLYYQSGESFNRRDISDPDHTGVVIFSRFNEEVWALNDGVVTWQASQEPSHLMRNVYYEDVKSQFYENDEAGNPHLIALPMVAKMYISDNLIYEPMKDAGQRLYSYEGVSSPFDSAETSGNYTIATFEGLLDDYFAFVFSQVNTWGLFLSKDQSLALSSILVESSQLNESVAPYARYDMTNLNKTNIQYEGFDFRDSMIAIGGHNFLEDKVVVLFSDTNLSGTLTDWARHRPLSGSQYKALTYILHSTIMQSQQMTTMVPLIDAFFAEHYPEYQKLYIEMFQTPTGVPINYDFAYGHTIVQNYPGQSWALPYTDESAIRGSIKIRDAGETMEYELIVKHNTPFAHNEVTYAKIKYDLTETNSEDTLYYSDYRSFLDTTSLTLKPSIAEEYERSELENDMDDVAMSHKFWLNWDYTELANDMSFYGYTIFNEKMYGIHPSDGADYNDVAAVYYHVLTEEDGPLFQSLNSMSLPETPQVLLMSSDLFTYNALSPNGSRVSETAHQISTHAQKENIYDQLVENAANDDTPDLNGYASYINALFASELTDTINIEAFIEDISIKDDSEDDVALKNKEDLYEGIEEESIPEVWSDTWIVYGGSGIGGVIMMNDTSLDTTLYEYLIING